MAPCLILGQLLDADVSIDIERQTCILISFCSEGVEYCISIECCCTDQGIVFYENKLLIRELQLVQSVVDRKFFRPIKLLKQFDHVIMLSSYGKGLGKTFTN